MADSWFEDLLAHAAHDLLAARMTRPVVVATPGVGAEMTQAVPGGTIWEILSVTTKLATSAVVGNRFTVLRATDADNVVLWEIDPPAGQAASTTLNHNWLTGQGYAGSISVLMAGLPSPPPLLLPGFVLRTSTAGLDAGDQYSATRITVREWDETTVMQEVAELDQNFADYVSQRTYTRENDSP